MQIETSGWVIVNIGHPCTGNEYIIESTFSFTKKECIKSFIEGSPRSWNHWYKKYNFRCVRATQLVQTIDKPVNFK